jgi:hypothetical protein
MSATTRGFVIGLVVGLAAYHIYQSRAPQG